jgi:hypothetical protein
VSDSWDVETFWEIRPRVLDRLENESAFTAEALFKLACAAAARRASLPDPQDVRVFADDNIVNPSMVDAYLPSREGDGTFAGYAERLRATTKSFALTINSLQQFDWEFWRALRRQTDSVLATTRAWSPGGVDCHLIASAYDTAPTLIHKDTAGVFTYVVSGFKRYYTWPYEVFSDIAGAEAMQRQVNLPSSIRYQDHLDTAIVVEGGPGSVLYWPSDRWHCATSDGNLSVSLHIAHYQWDDRLTLLLRRLQQLAAAELGVGRFEGGRSADATAADDTGDLRPVDARIRKVVSLLVDGADLDLDLRLRRLKRRTGSNFEVIPPLRPCTGLAGTDRLTVAAESVTRTQTTDDGTYLAVNGHVMRVQGGGWLDAYLPSLTPGTTHTLARWGELARAAGGPPCGPEFASLMRELVKRGALEHGKAEA